MSNFHYCFALSYILPLTFEASPQINYPITFTIHALFLIVYCFWVAVLLKTFVSTIFGHRTLHCPHLAQPGLGEMLLPPPDPLLHPPTIFCRFLGCLCASCILLPIALAKSFLYIYIFLHVRVRIRKKFLTNQIPACSDVILRPGWHQVLMYKCTISMKTL